jgi:hypothetical protein
VASIAAVLSMYDTDLIREVTDPRTGIMTSEKYMSFMPNAGELKVYCDGVAARKDRLQKLAELPKPDFTRARLPPPPPAPGDQATVFVPASNARYPQFVEWAKTADPRKWKFEARPGIWISFDTWDQLGHAVGRRLGDIARDIADDVRAEQYTGHPFVEAAE